MSRPKYRAWIFLSVLSLAIIVLGQYVGERQGVLWSVAIALGINSLFFFFGDWRIAPLLEGVELEGQDPWGLVPKAAGLAQRLRLPTPRLFILESTTPQALALGSRISSGRIYLTRELIESLSSQEMDCVLAYLFASIQRLHTLSFTVTAALVDLLLIVAAGLDRVLSLLIGSRKSPDAIQNRMITHAISPILALVMRLGVSAKDYYEIDQAAAQLCPQPKTLAQVLWKLESWAATKPMKTPAFMAHFYMVSPLTAKGWYRYFLVQPRAELRIRKLLGHFPI